MLYSPSSADKSSTTTTTPTRNFQGSNSTDDLVRSRNRRKDDVLRKKLEKELSRKPSQLVKNNKAGNHSQQILHAKGRIAKPGSVASLRPSPATTINENAYIVQAAQLMAAKRVDSVLVVDTKGCLVGILTDKDIAYRVVAEGLEPKSILVSQAMTRDPLFVKETDPRGEALSVMTQRKFRHLPVVRDIHNDEESRLVEESHFDTSSVIGLLDITKCVFDRLEELEKKVNEDENIIQAMETLEKNGRIQSSFATSVKNHHGCPSVNDVITQFSMENGFPGVGLKHTVNEAAKSMKTFHSTGVLVMNQDDSLAGIFTTKDIVLRVIAANLDPLTTSVVRVMTPHPDTIDASVTILDALKRMRQFNYMHLPAQSQNEIVGLVNVQQLTMAMLHYLYNKSAGTVKQDQKEVVWSAFWNSTFVNTGEAAEPEKFSDSLSMSVMSQGPNHILPSNSVSEVDITDLQASATISFKIKDTTRGATYKLTTKVESTADVLEALRVKLAVEEFQSPLYYLDEENDYILIGSEHDLQEALDTAKRLRWEKMIIVYGIPPTESTIINNELDSFIASDSVMIEKSEPAVPLPIIQTPQHAKNSSTSPSLVSQVAISAGIVIATAFVLKKFIFN